MLEDKAVISLEGQERKVKFKASDARYLLVILAMIVSLFHVVDMYFNVLRYRAFILLNFNIRPNINDILMYSGFITLAILIVSLFIIFWKWPGKVFKVSVTAAVLYALNIGYLIILRWVRVNF